MRDGVERCRKGKGDADRFGETVYRSPKGSNSFRPNENQVSTVIQHTFNFNLFIVAIPYSCVPKKMGNRDWTHVFSNITRIRTIPNDKRLEGRRQNSADCSRR